MSYDGSVVVGAGNHPDGRDIAWRWTDGGGFQDLGLLPNADGASAQAVSADGTVVAGNSGNSMSSYIEAFRWTQATGMVGLGDLPGGETQSGAAGISDDGEVVAGISAPGMVALPTLGGEFSVIELPGRFERRSRRVAGRPGDPALKLRNRRRRAGRRW